MVRKNFSKKWSEGFKPKHTIPPPEKLTPDTWLAFTLNPCDAFQFSSLRKERYFKHVEMFIPWVKDVCDRCEFWLYPELSGLGRIHYHGYLRIPKKDLLYFYLYTVVKLTDLCTVVIKDLTDEVISELYASWEDYASKQQHLFTALRWHTNTALKASPMSSPQE